jgi:hypothetical protein
MPPPIATINAVAGDVSFLLRHGRRPTATDDETERIATHLAFAQVVLRAAAVSHLRDSQRRARSELLGMLDAYVDARRFPFGEARDGRLPAFVDHEARRCAVAALVDGALGTCATERIDRRFHADFVPEISDPALATLVEEGGLSRAELALIQPAYTNDYLPPPPAIMWQADASGAAAVASGAPSDHPVRETLDIGVRWHGAHNYYIGDPIVALDAGAGLESGQRVPWGASARVGTEMLWWPGELVDDCSPCLTHRTGILAGVRVDADGSRVPRAWTVPVDAWWYVSWLGRHVHPGVTGGARVRFAGADRALGWTAGLDFSAPGALGRGAAWLPRNLHIGLATTRIADLTFVALTIGMSSQDRYDRHGHDW